MKKIDKKRILPLEQGSDLIWCRRLATLQGKQFHTSNPPADKELGVSLTQNHWSVSEYVCSTRIQNCHFDQCDPLPSSQLRFLRRLLDEPLRKSTKRKMCIYNTFRYLIVCQFARLNMPKSNGTCLETWHNERLENCDTATNQAGCDMWTKIGLYTALLTISSFILAGKKHIYFKRYPEKMKKKNTIRN